MQAIGHKYVVYIDNCDVRRDALSKLAFVKMRCFHLLSIDMKSAIQGFSYARKNIFDALIIHFPENRDWTPEEKRLIKISSQYSPPVFLVYEKNGNYVLNDEFENVNYWTYSCPISLLQKIQSKIRWDNVSKYESGRVSHELHQ